MSTKIRPEVSKKKEYHVSKERMYELQHFCRQYYEWLEEYRNLNSYAKTIIDGMPKNKGLSNPTEETAEKMRYYRSRIEMVEHCCKTVGDDLWLYLLKGVTEGLGYPIVNPPCCKETYYEMYRKFFWYLDKERC